MKRTNSGEVMLFFFLFGASTFASPANFNEDGIVNFADFSAFSRTWKTVPGDPNWNVLCDLSEPWDAIDELADSIRTSKKD